MKLPVRIRWLILILCLDAAVFTAILSDQWRESASRAWQTLRRAPPPRRPAAPPATRPEGGARTVEKFSFENAESLKAWEEKIFKGRTVYTVRNEDGRGYVNCRSEDASAGFFIKVDHEATEDLELSWDWRVAEFPARKDPQILAEKRQDDFAARIYVIFKASNILHADVIEYVWDENLPAGTFGQSPYSDRVQLYVIRGGRAADPGEWQSERRNIREDFVKLFGRQPKKRIAAIAFMTDSDNGQTRAEADFSELQFKRRSSPATGNGGPA